MATTKLGNSKSASRTINYCEKRATVKSGHNCNINYAKTQFKAVRAVHSKNDGVQAHTIIQSFTPGEVTPEQANKLGLELARSIAPKYQVAIYTHTDKNHIHNHIVINSVNMETGKKYQSNAEQRHLIKSENDKICLEHGLSVPEKSAAVRYTLAEKSLLEKEQTSWKDELRQAIDITKARTNDLKGFTEALDVLGIETRVREKTISYKHPDANKWVRGRKLGNDYTKGEIENGFERQIESNIERNNHQFNWDEYKRRNKLSGKTSRDRETERTDSTTYRPISDKYRAEQQRDELENSESIGNVREKQQESRRKNWTITRDTGGFER